MRAVGADTLVLCSHNGPLSVTLAYCTSEIILEDETPLLHRLNVKRSDSSVSFRQR
jgi:hypothetical protein